MSGFKGHIIGAVIVDILVISLLFFISKYLQQHFHWSLFSVLFPNYWNLAILILISIMFSLFPDIDTNSVGQHFFYFIFLALDIFLFLIKSYKWAAILGIFAMLPALSKHRGFTHSKIFAVIICSPLLLLPMYVEGNFTLSGCPYFSPALIGYLSHLLFDGKLL